MLTVYTWSKANRAGAWGGPEALASPPGEGDVVWVDLQAPTEAEEQAVFGQFLRVHPLTLEDITRPRREPGQPPHLPKVEEFPDYLLVIINPLTQQPKDALAAKTPGPEGAVRLNTQLSAVLTANVLVTHHYQPLGGCVGLGGYLRRHDAQAGRGPDYLFHLVLDAAVDEYAPLLDQVEGDLERIEGGVFTQPGGGGVLHQLLHLKRTVIALRKSLVYEREVLARLCRGEFALIDEREMAYYRNVYDHLIRFADLTEAAREMVTDLMQTHLAASSHRLNEVMKVLTMISTTILPMTLIAGVYGMNFKKWFPELEWEYGYPWALGLMALTGAASFVFFRWKGWI